MKNNILIIGAGAWGTSIANLIANNKKGTVYLWAYEKEVVDQINTKKVNNFYLPKIKLNKYIQAINNFKNIKANYVFIAVPSQFVFQLIKKYFMHSTKDNSSSASFIICSKGFDLKKKKLLSEVLSPFCSTSKIAILSGPSFAKLVAEKKPTAVTLACKNVKTANNIKDLLAHKYFRVYLNTDIVGVQLNGAIKNILAIAAGIADGLGYGENARATVISRGLNEIEKVSIAMGGKKNTILTLSGIGDILLTCTSISSRNYSFGFYLGKGISHKKILKNKSTVTEGIENSKALYLIKKKLKLDTPILDSVYKVLVKKRPINKIVSELLARPSRNE